MFFYTLIYFFNFFNESFYVESSAKVSVSFIDYPQAEQTIRRPNKLTARVKKHPQMVPKNFFFDPPRFESH